MGLPTGYQLRAPALDELGQVAAVLGADDLDDAGRVVLDEGFLRSQWSRVGFDLATDAWVVTDEVGTIVGYGQVMLEEGDIAGSWGVVHPQFRGRGLGSCLLDQTEERARRLLLPSRPSLRFRHAINAGDRDAAAMLAARGLRPVRHFWHMQAELPGRVEARPAPEGIVVASIRSPEDLPAVHAVLDEAFADHWGHEPEPFDRWVEDQTRGPRYDPALWLLARKDGIPVGALAASSLGDRGWVDQLGVLAPARGRGVGAALLDHSFAALAARGVRQVVLAVDAENPTGATVLYERAGMRVVKRWDLWERRLGDAAGEE